MKKIFFLIISFFMFSCEKKEDFKDIEDIYAVNKSELFNHITPRNNIINIKLNGDYYIKNDIVVNSKTLEINDSSIYRLTGNISNFNININNNSDSFIILNNVEINSINDIITSNTNKLNIILESNSYNELNTEKIAINNNSNIYVSGNGKLVIKAKEKAILSGSSIILNEGYYSFISSSNALSANEFIAINNSTLNIISDNDSIFTNKFIYLNSTRLSIDSKNSGIISLGMVEVDNSSFYLNTINYGIKSELDTIIKDSDITIKSNNNSIVSNNLYLINVEERFNNVIANIKKQPN